MNGRVDLQSLRVPLQLKSGRFADLVFTPHEYGDPHSVVVTLPRGSGNRVSLPRRFFAEDLGLDRLAPVAGK